MKNKVAAENALKDYSALVAAGAPMVERAAAFERYLAIANAPRSGGTEYSVRRNGRRFSVRWGANGNYSDIS